MGRTPPAEERLISELRERRREYERARARAAELVVDVSEDAFDRRPDPDAWSIGECIDHLITTGRAVVPYLEKGIEKGSARGWTGEGPFSYGRIGDWFVRLVGDDRLPPRRVPSPRLFRPAPPQSRGVKQTLEAFSALQDRLIELVHRANGLDLARIRCRSPVTPLLRLSLGQWLRMLAGHQRRHLWQARQVRRALGEEADPGRVEEN